LISEHHEVWLVLLAFFSELLGTLGGVSSSTLFVPLAKILESVPVTLALTATLHVLGNSVRTVLYWKSINWPLVLKFGGVSILFTGIGALFSDSFSDRIFSILLGLFLMSLSIYFLFFKSVKIYEAKWVPYFGGALSGLLTGMLGSGGAVRSLALAVFQLNPLTFVATSTLIDFGGDILRLGIYLNKGYLNSEHYFYVPLLMVVALLANWIAKAGLKRISKEKFNKMVLIFVFIMGLISAANLGVK